MGKHNTRVSKSSQSISSEKRLETMLIEAEKELELLAPKIEKMEKQLAKLNELKMTKQKLITLKLSLKSILSNFKEGVESVLEDRSHSKSLTLKNDVRFTSENKQPDKTHYSEPVINGLFLPDKAFEEAKVLLKRKNSLNYEIFRAIVFSGGQASTEDIRDYLIENDIKMPGSGKSIREVPLTDISSRANYLVRRGVVAPADRGVFVSNFGWETSGSK